MHRPASPGWTRPDQHRRTPVRVRLEDGGGEISRRRCEGWTKLGRVGAGRSYYDGRHIVTWTGTNLPRKVSAPKDARKATRSTSRCRCGSVAVPAGAAAVPRPVPAHTCERGLSSGSGVAGATPVPGADVEGHTLKRARMHAAANVVADALEQPRLMPRHCGPYNTMPYRRLRLQRHNQSTGRKRTSPSIVSLLPRGGQPDFVVANSQRLGPGGIGTGRPTRVRYSVGPRLLGGGGTWPRYHHYHDTPPPVARRHMCGSISSECEGRVLVN
jgi:hypothetical protein